MASRAAGATADIPNAAKLALERTRLAHERTLMAWVRTSTSLISFGFTIYKFFQYLREKGEPQPSDRLFGAREFAFLMISVGLVALLIAALQHRRYMKTLRVRHFEDGFSLATFVALLISGLGIFSLITVLLRE